jgi:hypothetical protein
MKRHAPIIIASHSLNMPPNGSAGEMGADGADETIVLQEDSLHLSPAEKMDRRRDGGDGVGVVAQEGASEDNLFQPVLLGMEAGDMPDVVGNHAKEREGDVVGVAVRAVKEAPAHRR